MVAWNKSPYTGEIIKCAIRKGMTTEAESIKTKAKSLYDNSTCATICNTKEFDNGNSSEVEYYFNSCNASAKETEVRSIYVAA
ncbi:MAG: hypothetical protein LBC61_04160 [Candidatus Peribacteria bacterium]|nr:hypothetical protein [Candidatus Peribacteria bacterium]